MDPATPEWPDMSADIAEPSKAETVAQAGQEGEGRPAGQRRQRAPGAAGWDEVTRRPPASAAVGSEPASTPPEPASTPPERASTPPEPASTPPELAGPPGADAAATPNGWPSHSTADHLWKPPWLQGSGNGAQTGATGEQGRGRGRHSAIPPDRQDGQAAASRTSGHHALPADAVQGGPPPPSVPLPPTRPTLPPAPPSSAPPPAPPSSAPPRGVPPGSSAHLPSAPLSAASLSGAPLSAAPPSAAIRRAPIRPVPIRRAPIRCAPIGPTCQWPEAGPGVGAAGRPGRECSGRTRRLAERGHRPTGLLVRPAARCRGAGGWRATSGCFCRQRAGFLDISPRRSGLRPARVRAADLRGANLQPH